MRTISYIIIHCADTYSHMDVGASEINEWHVKRGWNGIGYHYVIRRNGTIESGRDEQDVGAHVVGHNLNSIGVCWVGGKGNNQKPEDNRTERQKQALRSIINGLHSKYPDAIIAGHNDFDKNKACPCFNVEIEFGWLNKLQQDERETEESLEVVKRKKNEYRDGDNVSSSGSESVFPGPNASRTIGFHPNSRSGDRWNWPYSQRNQGLSFSKDVYRNKTEREVNSLLRSKFKVSIAINKIVAFFKTLIK